MWIGIHELSVGIDLAIEPGKGRGKMFRITKTFENEATVIFRIEGKITDENLSEWDQEIKSIRFLNGHHVILDFAQVWHISSKAVDVLMKLLTDRVYILNCGMEVRNVLHASGLSARMLE